jgi:polyphosphate glucokinase
MADHGDLAIGIDVGGSSIKAAVVDTSTGGLQSQRLKIELPRPSRPAAIIGAVERVVRRLKAGTDGTDLPIGVDVPSVVVDGITKTAANIDEGWIDFALGPALADALGLPVYLVNDADAAGVAEMRLGAAAGRMGTVLVATLGTGFGSALFYNGTLVPNFELGHMEIRGRPAEARSCAAARVRRELSWTAWSQDLDEHLRAIHRIMRPSLVVIGGGVSERADHFIPRLTVACEVVPATFRNDAGVIGAAVLAVDSDTKASTCKAGSKQPEDAQDERQRLAMQS